MTETPRDRLRELVEDVCREHNVCAKDVIGPSRFKCHIVARHDAIQRMHKTYPQLTTTQIARFFNRDHTTILNALGHLEKKRYRSTQPKLSATVRAQLSSEARRRNVALNHLITDIINIVVKDDLYRALLDD